MEQVELIKMRCAELEQAILTDNPEYKTILKDLHEKIRLTPELTYALADEQIAVIVSGLSKFTGVVIAEAKSKEKLTKAKAAKLSADDV